MLWIFFCCTTVSCLEHLRMKREGGRHIDPARTSRLPQNRHADSEPHPCLEGRSGFFWSAQGRQIRPTGRSSNSYTGSSWDPLNWKCAQEAGYALCSMKNIFSAMVTDAKFLQAQSTCKIFHPPVYWVGYTPETTFYAEGCFTNQTSTHQPSTLLRLRTNTKPHS